MSLATVALNDHAGTPADHIDAGLHVARVELASMNLLPNDAVSRLGPVWHALLACWSPPTTRELSLVAGLSPHTAAQAVSALRRLGVVATHHGCHHAVDPRSGRLTHPKTHSKPGLPRPPAAYLPGRPVLARARQPQDRLTGLLTERGLPPLPAAVTGPGREVLAELLEARRPLSSVDLAQRLNKHRGNIDRALQQLRAAGVADTEDHKHFPTFDPEEAPSQ